jgi:hypothetical protein
MLRLPTRFAAAILSFVPLFFQRSWGRAEVLLIGAILAPGKRTVTSLLRVTGFARERHFVNYHRVLSRAAWNPRAASRLLLSHLIEAFAPRGPVVLGIDDTIERRRGKRIAAMGIYRDPVRSSHGHFVIRDPQRRFSSQALLCTDLHRTPEQILGWFVQRWQLEVTFQETRAHLGVETQRQWSDPRTTPCLLALFSLVTLLAARLSPAERKSAASSAWYRKPHPTFSDTLAAVRRHIWREQEARRAMSSQPNTTGPSPCACFARLGTLSPCQFR